MKKQNSIKISFAFLGAMAFALVATGCSSKKVEETPADVAITTPAPVEAMPADVSLGASSSGRSR